MERDIKFAIIGGSGFYNLDEGTLLDSIEIETPWGVPSDFINIIELYDKKVAFLSRHGQGHRYTPSEVPYQANIAALKYLGVEQIFSFSAVGSLKEKLKPTDFVLVDQVIDKTKIRPATFFGDGLVGHIAFADPFCPTNPDLIKKSAQELGIALHTHETAVCMEGPAFSTRAESHLHRSWGAGVINMTVLPEAKLAREAGICYNVMCMVTDYDCWKEDEEAVTTEKVIEYLKINQENAKKMVEKLIANSGPRTCSCHSAVEGAILTDWQQVPNKTKHKYHYLYPERF